MNPVPYVPETGAGKMESIYGAGFTGIQGGPKKSKPDYFSNNFVYCQPISIIFGTYTL